MQLDVVPIPLDRQPSREFVFIDFLKRRRFKDQTVEAVGMAQWNALWESGSLRGDFLTNSAEDTRNEYPERAEELTQELAWLQGIGQANALILPITRSMYTAYAPLYQLMPASHLARFGLDPMGHAIWPPLVPSFNEHQRGAPAATIRDTLGHASLSTTDLYLSSVPTDGSSLYLKF